MRYAGGLTVRGIPALKISFASVATTEQKKNFFSFFHFVGRKGGCAGCDGNPESTRWIMAVNSASEFRR